MRETQDRLRHYLEQRIGRLFEDQQGSALALPYATAGACWWMHAAVDETRGALTITSHCPVLTPRDRLGEMCEYLQRCQNEIVCGQFRLDFRDGEVTFRTSVIFGDADLEEELIRHLFEGNVDTVDYFLPGMLAVAYGDTPPAEAVHTPVWPQRLFADEVDTDLKALLEGADQEAGGTTPAGSASDADADAESGDPA